MARLKPWMITFSARPCWARDPFGSSDAAPAPAAARNCRRVAVIVGLPRVVVRARSNMRSLFQALPDVAAQIEKFRRALDLVVARPCEWHLDDALDAPRTRRHHDDAVGQIERL